MTDHTHFIQSISIVVVGAVMWASSISFQAKYSDLKEYEPDFMQYQQKESSAPVKLGLMRVMRITWSGKSSSIYSVTTKRSLVLVSMLQQCLDHAPCLGRRDGWESSPTTLPITFPSLDSSKSLPSKTLLQPWKTVVGQTTVWNGVFMQYLSRRRPASRLSDRVRMRHASLARRAVWNRVHREYQDLLQIFL